MFSKNRGRLRRAFSGRSLVQTIVAMAGFGMMGGFVLRAKSCCEKKACSQIQLLANRIAQGSESCCNKPASEQSACFNELDTKVQNSHDAILAAQIACDNSDDELLRDAIKRLQDIWLPKPKPVGGIVLNEMIALGRKDWLHLDMALARSDAACVPVTVAIVGEQVVNAEATGSASEGTVEAVVTGEVPATIVSASGNQAFQACEYVIPSGTTLDMRFGEELSGLAMSGSIAVARTTTGFPSSGMATVALPTNISFSISKWGQTLRMDLDKTFAYNKLEVDANGNGTLGVALKISSNSSNLIGFVQIGSTIYFTFPVQVAADWSTIRLHADPTIPGNHITPMSDLMLEVLEGEYGLASLPTDRCADEDGNGIRDSADEQINAMNKILGCKANN
jgi:hypothetical protein